MKARILVTVLWNILPFFSPFFLFIIFFPLLCSYSLFCFFPFRFPFLSSLPLLSHFPFFLLFLSFFLKPVVVVSLHFPFRSQYADFDIKILRKEFLRRNRNYLRRIQIGEMLPWKHEKMKGKEVPYATTRCRNKNF